MVRDGGNDTLPSTGIVTFFADDGVELAGGRQGVSLAEQPAQGTPSEVATTTWG